MNKTRNRPLAQNHRNGVTLVLVLVLLSVATIIMLGALSSTLRQRRQLRQELQLEQTRWLVDAGVRKSLEELKHDPDYQGETIKLPSPLRNYKFVTLDIQRIKSSENQSGETMRVEANVSVEKDDTLSTKRSHNFQIK